MTSTNVTSVPTKVEHQTEQVYEVGADNTHDGALGYWRLSPASAELTPYTASIASNYRRYRLVEMDVRYIPNSTTSVDGSLSMGFTASTNTDDISKTSMRQWSNFCETALFKEARMIIRPNVTNQSNGSNWMLLPDNSDQVETAPNLYHLGTLAIRGYRVSDDDSWLLVGKLNVTATYEFTDRQTNGSADSANVVMNYNGGVTTWDVTPGSFSVEAIDVTGFNGNSYRPFVLIHYSADVPLSVANYLAFGAWPEDLKPTVLQQAKGAAGFVEVLYFHSLHKQLTAFELSHGPITADHHFLFAHANFPGL